MKNMYRYIVLATLISAETLRAASPEQDTLINVLTSDAPAAVKAPAFKQLARIGTADAAPVVARYLADPQLASWSRITLEALPGPQADAALRAALDTLQGRLLIGAINSIGVRRDTGSVAALIVRLPDPDAQVLAASAAALARIGGDDATTALQTLLTRERPEARAAAAEALIVCAEGWMRLGQASRAAALYEQVRAANISHQRTLEATRGAILARGKGGLGLLASELESPDRSAFHMALRTAREVREPAVGSLLAKLFRKSADDRKAGLLYALSDRGDERTHEIAVAALGSAALDVRLAGVETLIRTGSADALAPLVKAARDADEQIARAARTGITLLRGRAIDQALVALLSEKDVEVRRLAVELVRQRQLDTAVSALLKNAATEPDEALRTDYYEALGELAGEEQIPDLIARLLKSDGSSGTEQALRAVVARVARPSMTGVVIQQAVYGRIPDGPAQDVTARVKQLLTDGRASIEASNGLFGDTAPGIVKQLRIDRTVHGRPVSSMVQEGESVDLSATEAPASIVDALCRATGKASPAARGALLRILRGTGSPAALEPVRAAMAEADPTLRETAIRVLCDWPAPEALSDLETLGAQAGVDPKFALLALRARIRLIPLDGVSLADRVRRLDAALGSATRSEEKRLALSALAGLPCPEALQAVRPFLKDPELKDDAGATVVILAGPLLKNHRAAVEPVLAEVIAAGGPAAEQAKKIGK